MYTLIAFATQWGSRHGGINSFNADFLTNFGAAYHHGVQIVCVVTDHTPEAAEEALKAHVRLVALPYVPANRSVDPSIGTLSVDLLSKAGIGFDPECTVWVGHDLITGKAAVSAARVGGGRSAVIHHMSYSDYESYAEDSDSALEKTAEQTAILKQADLVLAIGPLLRDAASDRLGASKEIHMVVPGLPEIDSREAPKTFVAFLSGRLTPDAARIKQGHLGIAAFAAAESRSHADGIPEALKRQPKLLLRGVDFENRISDAAVNAPLKPETELKDFTELYAEGVINVLALPYTEDREQLYSELSAASVALMPSWHEGFGLVAWEAIAAGVPLIVGQNTGVYRLLEEELFGAQTGYVYALDVRGQRQPPYFRPEDLEATASALKAVAMNPANARNRAGMLRNMLLEKYTWTNCCENIANLFGWDLQKGSVPDRTSEVVKEVLEQTSALPSSTEAEPLKIPRGQWRAGAGMADSQLLRAEEEVLPFDERRQPEVEKLTEWATNTTEPITIRLITGEGGQGKTRLAIHICQQLRKKGWYAGFLDSGLDANRMPLLWRDLSKLDQPIFIVVDYAETRQDAFLALLKAALQTSSKKPVRLLLLARNGGEWWDNLPSMNSFCEVLLSGPATTGPFGLSPLYEGQQDRRQAFANALAAFAERLKVQNPRIVPDLIGDQFERPLFVQMAALLALYGERPITIQGLTKALLNHERRYWVALLEPTKLQEPGRRAEQLLTLATLAGGFPTAKIAEGSWTAAKGSVLKTSEFNSLFRNLTALYPGAEGLQALRPDLLGEALVAQAILRPDSEVLLDAVLTSSSTQSIRRNALTVIARITNARADLNGNFTHALARQLVSCGADLVAVSTQGVSRLPELAMVAFEQLSLSLKNQIAGQLKVGLREESVQLAGLSHVVFGHLVYQAEKRLKEKPSSLERMVDYTLALDAFGSSLFQLNNYKEACEASHTNLEIVRKLIAKDRQRYEQHYARTLMLHGVYLSEAARAEESLIYDDEALKIYQRLAKEKPNKFDSDYALALINNAAHLAFLGRHAEAVKQAELAVSIHQRCVEKSPETFEPLYAQSLSNYATELGNVGRPSEAITRFRDALDILQRLTHKHPDRFEPKYAASLARYGRCLADAGQFSNAIEAAQEAYVIYKRLAEKLPMRFGVDVVQTLCSVRLLRWLFNKEDPDQGSVEAILSVVFSHENNLAKLEWAFVQGCLNEAHTARRDHFRLVLSIGDDLAEKGKMSSTPLRLCAAAWSAKFDSLENTDWQNEWREYSTNLRGNLPVWLLEVAQRLQFEFPPVHL